MPSNNKKSKKNANKKDVAREKSASAKKTVAKAAVGSTKPHFFDKSKMDFLFSEKKINDGSVFVSPDESAEEGFVTAHFFHSENNVQVKKSVAAHEEKNDKPEVETSEIVAESMSELMKDSDLDKTEHRGSTELFSRIVVEELKNDSDTSDIGMKELFSEDKAEAKESESVGKMSAGLVFAESGSAIEPPSSDTEKKHPENDTKKADARKKPSIVFGTSDSDSRRENEAILAALTPEDIKKNGEKEKKKYTLSVLRYLAMVLCLAVLVVSSVNLVSDFARKSLEKNKNEKLREAFNSGVIGYTTLGYARQDTSFSPDERLYSDEGDIYKAPEPEVYDMHEKYERMLPNLQALKYVNSSAFAWIKVGGTRVDYPVVRSPHGDNDYYLSHGLDRTYSVSGAVFTDYNNSTRLSNNKNTCVYGHNMNDGTMFQTIMNFKDKNQFLNSSIEMYTAEGLYVYIPFAAYDAEPTESFFKTEFASEEDFVAFLADIKTKSIFTKPGISLDKNSKVVTLITCTNTVTDKRFVVHGVLEEIVK